MSSAGCPNVVLVHCHDLGQFLSCYGARTVPSPHIDALAARSVVFDNAFSTAPLCTPARSSLFTGQSPHVNGLMGLAHQGWRYRKSVVTVPELLSACGYRTTLIGLQHEHPDANVLGFDEVRGMGFLPRALPVANEAEAWLRARGGAPDPFFLTVGMWEVHRPWPAADYDHADPDAIDLPPFVSDNEHSREDFAGFFGAIGQLDAAVGQVVEAVDRYCDLDNTMVVFTTDHGAPFPRAKGTLYDPGVEVPLIVRPPGSWAVPPGRRTGLVSHLDVAPTLLDLAGAPPNPALEGTSLAGRLRSADAGPGDDDERMLFFEKTFHDRYDPMRAVRTGRFKLIRNFVDGPALVLSKDLEDCPTRKGMGDAHLAARPPVELYDLGSDPGEMRNLVAEPAYADIMAALDAELIDWMNATMDPLLDAPVDAPPRPTRLVDAQPDLPAPSSTRNVR